MAAIRFKEVISSFILNRLENHPSVSLDDFVKENKDFIIQNTNLGDNIEVIWTKRFGTTAKELKVKLTRSTVNWGSLALEYLTKCKQSRDTVSDCSTSEASSYSYSSSLSLSSSAAASAYISSRDYKLSIDDKENIKKMYNSLNTEKMWKLSSGTIVEKIMEKVALACEYEHPAHSLILDPQEASWSEHFTVEELKEIAAHKAPKFQDFPKEMEEYIKSYKTLYDIEELWDHNQAHTFHPKKQADLYWLHQSIINTLELYFYNLLDKGPENSESDLIHRVWRPIYSCFNCTSISVNSGEVMSSASSRRKNANRVLPTITPIERKKLGTRVDLLFRTTVVELGTAEFKRNEDEGSQCLREIGLKCPKAMKDMMVALLETAPTELGNISTHGFQVSGLLMNQLTLTIPEGYVCRVSRLSQPLRYPDSPKQFFRYLYPILKVIWNVKLRMAATLERVNEEQGEVPLSYDYQPQTSEMTIPSCFSPNPTKKRKFNK